MKSFIGVAFSAIVAIFLGLFLMIGVFTSGVWMGILALVLALLAMVATWFIYPLSQSVLEALEMSELTYWASRVSASFWAPTVVFAIFYFFR